jgi:CheY-like chemotaxis protein
LDKIFEMFVQVDHSFERSQGGLGIGLTLARRLVELHEGSIAAYSAGVGCGSEFVVRLPLRVAPKVAEAPGAPEQTAAQTRHRIVVADDNEDYAASSAALLGMQGHEVHVAHDGHHAVEIVAATHPDVVLLDIGLPRLDGYEVARRIRAMPGMEDTLLVAITGWGQPRDRQLAREAGFDEHLVKPVEPEMLLRLSARGRRGARVATSPVADAAGAVTGARVLVVDDNAAVQASASDLLREAGYDVKAVGDGHAALECAESWHPRFVLIDTNMPIMNGFEVARRLRARYPIVEMKLIMMSGLTVNDAVRSSATSAGFDAIIDKMAEPEQWMEILRTG